MWIGQQPLQTPFVVRDWKGQACYSEYMWIRHINMHYRWLVTPEQDIENERVILKFCSVQQHLCMTQKHLEFESSVFHGLFCKILASSIARMISRASSCQAARFLVGNAHSIPLSTSIPRWTVIFRMITWITRLAHPGTHHQPPKKLSVKLTYLQSYPHIFMVKS